MAGDAFQSHQCPSCLPAICQLGLRRYAQCLHGSIPQQHLDLFRQYGGPIKHIWEVLQRLHQHKLFTKPEKCEFHSDSVEYLRYFLSPDGLTMSQDKVTAICNWPEPRKVKDIQSFLSFTNFYRCFIFNYSDIVVPLTWLTWKDAPWNFSEDC